ncbi:MAG TPA: ABC transporter substrate-binding protein [Acidimicrobiales bacterium]
MVTPLRGGAPLRPSRPLTRRVAASLLALAAALTAACGDTGSTGAAGDGPGGASAPAADTGRNPAGCVEGAEPGDDLFPDRFAIRHAENLSLSYHGTYKVVRVAEPSPGAGDRVYVLAQCGTEPPPLEGELAEATVVEVPVRSLFTESTSHLGFADELGIAGAVTGVMDGELVVTPSVRERVDAGAVTSFAPGGVIDTERVIAEDPDVYVTAGTEDAAHEVLTEAGVPVVAAADWLETSPQAWSEWIALFAALTNTEARATRFHERLVADYEAAAELVADVAPAERPTVITGSLFEGEWNAQGGAGIVPRFIADAGGDYVYADDPSTGTLVLDIEAVLADARDADVWLSPLGDFGSRAEAVAADERYGRFAAWERGGVWANDDPDLLERGPVAIDEYLLDYIAILHPDRAPEHELVFFRRVPEG